RGGDPVELREALTNLILNAVDAMPDGGALTLSTMPVGDEVELTVSDSGVGMPDIVRQRIFDPFFTTKGVQGTGLGLSITYGILTRHRARVRVESEPGQGTTFRITLEPAGNVDVPEVLEAVAEPTGAPLRWLVVGDDEAVGGVIGDILETNGHSVVVLTNGAAGYGTHTRNRSEAYNANDMTLGRDLLHAVLEADDDAAVRAIVGTGAGKAFCAGGDVKAFDDNLDHRGALYKELATYLHGAVSRLCRSEKPVIMAINGVAAGGGMSLALA